jgi:hypothetical protein
MRKFFLIVIIFSLATNLHAQKKYVYEDSTLYQTVEEPPLEEKITTVIGEKEEENEPDTTLHYSKMFIEPDSIEAWKKIKGFGYLNYIDSLLKSKKNEKDERQQFRVKEDTGPTWLEKLFSNSVMRWIFWVLAGAFVLFIIYRLFLAEGIFKKSSTKADNKQPLAEEEIITPESDFDKLIRQAMNAGNYRLAVRYQYLKTLHLLAEKNYVQLAVDKTNFMYVREIANYDLQNAFARLTLNYEYVWYGEFTIDEIVYRNMENGFSTFNAKI